MATTVQEDELARARERGKAARESAADSLSDADRETIARINALPEEERTPDDWKTLEELANEGVGEDRTPPTQLAIPGTRERITSTFGGKNPTDSELRIMGGKRPIVGSFDKGEALTVLASGTIRSVEGSDTDDDFGTVSKTTRIHKLRMLHVRVATPESLARTLLGQVSKAEAKALLDQIDSE